MSRDETVWMIDLKGLTENLNSVFASDNTKEFYVGEPDNLIQNFDGTNPRINNTTIERAIRQGFAFNPDQVQFTTELYSVLLLQKGWEAEELTVNQQFWISIDQGETLKECRCLSRKESNIDGAWWLFLLEVV